MAFGGSEGGGAEIREAEEPGAASLNGLDAIRSEQVALLFASVTTAVLGALGGAAMLVAALVHAGTLSPRSAVSWLSFGVLLTAAHIGLGRLYRRRPAGSQSWRPWGYGFTAISFAEGLWWGFATLFLAAPNDFDGQILTLLVPCGIAAGAVTAFSSYLPAFCAIFFPATAPLLVRGLLQGGSMHAALAALSAVFIVAMGSLGFRNNANVTAVLRLNHEKDALAEKLRREKERAEAANLSKSRFLASASHDLRQPVHSLGLFIGALSSHPMNAEMRRLVAHMEDSVTALDGLFGSLLDISRIDAGVVRPEREPIELQPLLQRICNDHAAEAENKGNQLTLRPCAAVVYTDPILLERILRNVVSNAVRYTAGGRILVGCRRGERIRIEVHDTGMGIPLDEQQRIFEEFYQIKNPERDRAKGLGLGLAIVKRLTTVLDHPFELSSTPGRGTMFRLFVPRADEGRPPPPRSETPWVGAQRRGLILVVEDEANVREGMRSLLSSWGHEVLVAASGADMIERIADHPVRADLIICDYRLRDDENGIDVILRLQSEYNDEIPAVLVTGDTAPGRLAEAKASGFALLHKPVANAKLRAAISHLMSSRAADENTE